MSDIGVFEIGSLGVFSALKTDNWKPMTLNELNGLNELNARNDSIVDSLFSNRVVSEMIFISPVQKTKPPREAQRSGDLSRGKTKRAAQ